MRALGLQVLTTQIQGWRPGVTIYGIGDEDHKGEVSGHNEDDTAGVRAEDQDADSTPEHRAIDVMLGPSFSKTDADTLVAALVDHAANRSRLLYVIFGGQIWSRSRNWVPAPKTDDPHHDHVHISGEADADENTAAWVLTSPTSPGDEMTTPEPVEWVQDLRMRALIEMKEEYAEGPYGSPTGVATQNKLAQAINRIEKAVTTAQPVLLSDEDRAAIVAALRESLPSAVRAVIREELDKTRLGVQ